MTGALAPTILAPMRPALLVVDLQNEFFAPGSPAVPSLTSAVEHVNEAVRAFRAASLPIVVVRDVEEPARVPGQTAFEVHASVAIDAADPHVDKRHANAFWETDLERLLRAQRTDFVVVSGFCAEFCVLSTYRGARERGFSAALLRGGIASGRDDHLAMVERVSEVISIEPLVALTRALRAS